MGKTFYIADLHIGHTNVLSFDNRPFSTIDEHDAFIAENWNNTVTDDDDVYILGDISFMNFEKTYQYYVELKGKKHLIKGNHDKSFFKNPHVSSYMDLLFTEICDYKELYLDDKHQVVLCHYPIPCFKNSFRGWYHLYGHVHNSMDWNIMEKTKSLMKELYSKKDGKLETDICNMYNVGCMLEHMKYTPRTLDEIIENYKTNG